MRKLLLLLLFTFASTSLLLAQSNYTVIFKEAYGDLNNDGMSDKVRISMDTISPSVPFLLEVFLSNKNSKPSKLFSSDKTLWPKFPGANESTYATVEELEIKKGVLIIRNQLLKSSFTHKFRYQNGHFELIGFSSHSADPGYLNSTDYNLSTGKKIMIKMEYETDKILEKVVTNEKIRPLPKLENFTPLDFDF